MNAVKGTTSLFNVLPPIHCRNPSLVRSKLDKIIQDGSQHLHIISDFDMTMTRYWVNGQRNISSHGLINRWSKCSSNFKEATEALYRKYYPIEVSTELTHQEKVPHMVAWWREAHDLIIQESISEQDLATIVRECPIQFRPSLHETVELCQRLQIPFLVFSAGLADLIEEVLRYERLYLPAMHVISNRMIFDTQTRRVIGFAEPIVHVFNKNEFTGLLSGMTTISGDDATCDNSSSNNDSVHHLHGSMDSLADTKSTVIIGGTQLTGEDGRRYRESLAQYKQMISHRRNVILMGDSLGDIQMGHGVRHDVLLSVGYLNQYQCMPDGRWVDSSERQQGPPTSQAIIDKTVQQYLDTFDIVISADSGLDVLINPLLQALK